MRYIAKIEEEKILVSGIKEMLTENGELVEVIIDTKEYDLEKLEEVIENYKLEFALQTERYENDINDLNKIVEAIKSVK